MDATKEESLQHDKAIGDILGIVNCLLISADVETFKKWINEFHSSELGDDYLLGYKLAYYALFGMLTSELERNVSLGLTSDDIFERATFKGISVHKLPNTCEKTVLIRNLRLYFDDVLRSNSWANLVTAMQRLKTEVLAPFNNIKMVSSLAQNRHVSEIETAITYSSMFQTYIFLNDTSKGIPHGYLPAMFDIQEDGFEFQVSTARTQQKAFWGYKYAVQFLWHQLLGGRYKSSVVSDIHETNDWNSFDQYFDKIKSGIIEPLEKSTGGVMGYDSFVLVDSNPKKYFKGLLEKKMPEWSPSTEENFNRVFLWYPIQLVDSSNYSFSGAPALIALLMGMIQINRRSEDKSQAKVVRIIHGGVEEHRRSYSYAILIELRGYMSDSSGWLLFFDCCDDRGSTSRLFKQVESLLSRYAENNFIEISSIRIDKVATLEFAGDTLRKDDF